MFWLMNIVLYLFMFQKLCQSQLWQPPNPSHFFQGYNQIQHNHKFQKNKQLFISPTQSPLFENLQHQTSSIQPHIIIVPIATPFQKNNVDFQKPKTQTFYKASLLEAQSPIYEFRYKVHDPKQNNYQEKFETRIGDAVKGYYSVREPNGYLRLVKYVSDKNGFQTQVSHHHTDSIGGSGFVYTSTQHPN